MPDTRRPSLNPESASLALLALSGLLASFLPDGFRSIAAITLCTGIALVHLSRQLRLQIAKRAEAEDYSKLLIEAAECPHPAACLDIEKGIQQIGGSRELYMSLLHRFTDEYGATPDALESEIGKGNLPGAALIAQSVKGIAGVLAALPLQCAAAELERALPHGGKRVRVTLAGFRHELENVLGALPEEIRRCS